MLINRATARVQLIEVTDSLNTLFLIDKLLDDKSSKVTLLVSVQTRATIGSIAHS